MGAAAGCHNAHAIGSCVMTESTLAKNTEQHCASSGHTRHALLQNKFFAVVSATLRLDTLRLPASSPLSRVF